MPKREPGTRNTGPKRGVALAATILILVETACVSRPRPTEESVRRATQPSAIVEGRVVDPQGAPVAGVSVKGLPRDKDLGWSPSSVTDGRGRFELRLVAPGEYGFLVSWKGITVVTPREDDPSRVHVRLAAGERRAGVELVFRRDDWERARPAE